jgi:hypothetical protein
LGKYGIIYCIWKGFGEMKKMMIVMLLILLTGCDIFSQRGVQKNPYLVEDMILDIASCDESDGTCVINSLEELYTFSEKHGEYMNQIETSIFDPDGLEISFLDWSNTVNRSSFNRNVSLMGNYDIFTYESYSNVLNYAMRPILDLSFYCAIHESCDLTESFEDFTIDLIAYDSSSMYYDFSRVIEDEDDTIYYYGSYSLLEELVMEFYQISITEQQITYYQVLDGRMISIRYNALENSYTYTFVDLATNESLYFYQTDSTNNFKYYTEDTGFSYTISTKRDDYTVSYYLDDEFVVELTQNNPGYIVKLNMMFVDGWDEVTREEIPTIPFKKYHFYNQDQELYVGEENYTFYERRFNYYHTTIICMIETEDEESLHFPEGYTGVISMTDLLDELERIQEFEDPASLVGLTSEEIRSNMEYVYTHILTVYDEQLLEE